MQFSPEFYIRQLLIKILGEQDDMFVFLRSGRECCKEIKELQREELKILRSIEQQLKEAQRIQDRNKSALLLLYDTKGAFLMPASIVVGGNGAQAAFTEWSGLNGTGSQVAPVGAVSFTSDNPAVATVDPTSGLCTAVSVGTANISGADAGNSLTASDALTVTAAVAQSATLTLTAL